MQEETKDRFSVTAVPEKIVNGDIKKSFWRINKEMLPLKLHFFLFIGGMSAILPFQSAVGITRFGLTASNLAAAYSTQQCLFIVLKPSIGYLADYFNKLKATIIGLTIIQAISCICMILVPATDKGNILGNPESQLSSSLEELQICHLCNHYQEYKEMSSNLPFDQDILKEGINCLKHPDNKLTHTTFNCLQQQNKSISPISVNFQIKFATCNISSELDALSASYLASTSVYRKQFFFINISVNDTRITNIICPYTGYDISNSSGTKYTLSVMEQHCFSVLETDSVTIENLLTKFCLSPQILNCKNFTSNTVQQKDEYIMYLSAANFKTYQFWLFLMFLVCSCVPISCIFTMSDTACHEIAHKTGNDYGQQRLWGAMSWGVIAPLAGFLNDFTDGYLAAWCMMVVLCSLQIWNLSRMNLMKPNISQNFRKDLKIVFSSKEFIAFEVGVFMNGVFTGVVWFYLTWFITVIGGNRLQIGLAHTIQCFLGEVPFMFFSGWLIKKLGHFNLVSLALFSHGVRFVCYSYLHNAWWILPIECLHGLTFGSFYSAMTSYGKLNSKPGTEATTQSVLCSTYEALGAGIGCVISGICFDRYGAQKTFLYAALFCALATCINMLSTFVIKCKKDVQDDSKTTATDSGRY